MNSSRKLIKAKKMFLVTNGRGQVKKKLSKFKMQTIVFTIIESRPGKIPTAATRTSPCKNLDGRSQHF